MQVYYIDENLKKNNTAGAKAPEDIAKICESIGFSKILMPMLKYTHTRVLKNIEVISKNFLFWLKLFISLPKETIIIYQHPTLGKRLAARVVPFFLRFKSLKIIAIIHDLESLRGGIGGMFSVNEKYCKEEIELLQKCACVICHNNSMKEYLISKGLDDSKIVELELFDYLSEANLAEVTDTKDEVCIAGNLAPGKCGYIYEMFGDKHNKDLIVNLFGANFEDRNISNLKYNGSFPPEKLSGLLKGKFGIVWDGMSATTCSGNTGEYLRYNNPHKTSLYLCAGLPVVVWDQAAIANFVLKNKVGIAIDNLYCIEEKIIEIPEEAYQQMLVNAKKISERVREGFYTKKAIATAIGRCT